MALLTKSKYLYGLQCPRLLWTVFNAPENIPGPDASTRHIFDQGQLVGNLAKKMFPGGIEIPTDDFSGNISGTRKALAEGRPLFEPGFLAGNLFARPDILLPAGEKGWDIIEVKSSTQVKDIHLHDVSFQKHCIERSGTRVRKCYLMHINSGYVRKGDIDPEGLFVKEDITAEVDSAILGIQDRIDAMFEIISSKICPDTDIGCQCSDPYGCALHDDCWASVPEGSVFELYKGGKRSQELFEKGILSIKDIPAGTPLTPKQQVQVECEKTGKPHVEKEKIKVFLDKLEYPLNYLDFETICRLPVPLYEGMRPYQNIPFQFSLHVQSKDGLRHHSFLATGKADPREGFLSALKGALGNNGSIVVYNQQFETGRLKELADSFPGYREWINSLYPRFIDLLVLFRNFWYYSPRQHGSASLKSVLPALTGKGYDEMEIDNGEMAFLEYLRITFGDMAGRLPDRDEIKKVRDDLEKYCCLDTEAMVWIVDEMRKIIS